MPKQSANTTNDNKAVIASYTGTKATMCFVFAALVDGFWRHWYGIDAKSRREAMTAHEQMLASNRPRNAKHQHHKQPIRCVADPYHILDSGDCIPAGWNGVVLLAEQREEAGRGRQDVRDWLRCVVRTENKRWEEHHERQRVAYVAACAAQHKADAAKANAQRAKALDDDHQSVIPSWTSVDTSVE